MSVVYGGVELEGPVTIVTNYKKGDFHPSSKIYQGDTEIVIPPKVLGKNVERLVEDQEIILTKHPEHQELNGEVSLN